MSRPMGVMAAAPRRHAAEERRCVGRVVISPTVSRCHAIRALNANEAGEEGQGPGEPEEETEQHAAS